MIPKSSMRVCSSMESLRTKSFLTVDSLAEKSTPSCFDSPKYGHQSGAQSTDVFPPPLLVGVAIRMEAADLQQQGPKLASSCALKSITTFGPRPHSIPETASNQ